MPILLKPYASIPGTRGVSRFFLSDCRDVFRHLQPHSVDVIVTSPPYNLGIQYSQYEDSLSPAEYLAWTAEWVAGAARVLRPDGSLFLNVGTRPSDPWTALDVAQAARPHLRLQNIIHWIKSIAIDRGSTGAAAGLDARSRRRPLQTDQQRPLPQRLPRVRLSLHAERLDAARSARPRRAVSGPIEHRPVALGRGRVRCRGNTWFIPTRPFSGATATVRIPRRSRRSCPSSACGCTGCRGSASPWTRFSASAARPSPAPASA